MRSLLSLAGIAAVAAAGLGGCCECNDPLPPIAVFVTVLDTDGTEITTEEDVVVRFQKDDGEVERCRMPTSCGYGPGHYRIIATVRGMTLEEEVEVILDDNCCTRAQHVTLQLPA